jgi:hypothetical protein
MSPNVATCPRSETFSKGTNERTMNATTSQRSDTTIGLKRSAKVSTSAASADPLRGSDSSNRRRTNWTAWHDPAATTMNGAISTAAEPSTSPKSSR